MEKSTHIYCSQQKQLNRICSNFIFDKGKWMGFNQIAVLQNHKPIIVCDEIFSEEQQNLSSGEKCTFHPRNPKEFTFYGTYIAAAFHSLTEGFSDKAIVLTDAETNKSYAYVYIDKINKSVFGQLA